MTVQRPPYAIQRRVRPRNLTDDFGADPTGATDASSAIQKWIDAVPYAGGVATAYPGRYRMQSEVDMTDRPSMKIVGLGGKHYQGKGTTASPSSTGGVIFEGFTPGMTMFNCSKTTNADATHQGPTFEDVAFQDGRFVASRLTITAVVLASGTTYTYTTAATHPFVAGDSVFVNGIALAAEPYGNALNGRYTVAASPAPTATTFSINVGSTVTLTGLDFSSADVRYTATMTLLTIAKQTRSRLRDCHFHGGLVGLRLDPGGGDVSWGNLYGCSFNLNETGVLGVGSAAQSVAINGGDFQVGAGQIGIDFATGNTAMFKARDFKLDTIYNDGTGAIGIRLQNPSNYQIDGSFETDGPAIAIQLGTTGNSYGRIASNFQANNTGTKGSRVGTGVQLTGTTTGTTDTNTGAGEMSLMGSSFNGYSTCVDVDNARNAKVIGGSYAFCDRGVNVGSGAQGTIVAFFTRRRTETGSDTTAGNVVVNAGVGTKQIFCDDVNAAGDLVPAAGATTMTSGFVSIPSGAGAPSGVPTTYAGTVPLYYDRTNHKLYIYDSGWKTQSAVFA